MSSFKELEFLYKKFISSLNESILEDKKEIHNIISSMEDKCIEMIKEFK